MGMGVTDEGSFTAYAGTPTVPGVGLSFGGVSPCSGP